jgi:hypothetical protein
VRKGSPQEIRQDNTEEKITGRTACRAIAADRLRAEDREKAPGGTPQDWSEALVSGDSPGTTSTGNRALLEAVISVVNRELRT